jgi:hypothetical protein
MRAWDITRIIIGISAAIGFVNGSGLFTEHYYATVQSGYTSYTVGDLNATLQQAANGPSISDYFNAIVSLVLSGLWVLLNILGAIVCLLPYLIFIFHMPWYFAGILQVYIYIEYQAGIAQWRAGRQMGWIQ